MYSCNKQTFLVKGGRFISNFTSETSLNEPKASTPKPSRVEYVGNLVYDTIAEKIDYFASNEKATTVLFISFVLYVAISIFACAVVHQMNAAADYYAKTEYIVRYKDEVAVFKKLVDMHQDLLKEKKPENSET